MGFVYVVGPNGANYDVDGFLESVHKLGDNLVTALCDYNGMAKRETAKKLPRVTLCRLCLVSGGVYKHKDVTKLDVAKSLLNVSRLYTTFGIYTQLTPVIIISGHSRGI